MSVLPDHVRALVEGPNVAHTATLLPEGAPHSVPVWVGMEGERIAFLTSPSCRKARNVARDPRVAISLTVHDRPFTMAAIRGRVVERLDGDPAWAIIDWLARKYTGADYGVRSDRSVYLVAVEHSWGQAL